MLALPPQGAGQALLQADGRLAAAKEDRTQQPGAVLLTAVTAAPRAVTLGPRSISEIRILTLVIPSHCTL